MKTLNFVLAFIGGVLITAAVLSAIHFGSIAAVC